MSSSSSSSMDENNDQGRFSSSATDLPVGLVMSMNELDQFIRSIEMSGGLPFPNSPRVNTEGQNTNASSQPSSSSSDVFQLPAPPPPVPTGLHSNMNVSSSSSSGRFLQSTLSSMFRQPSSTSLSGYVNPVRGTNAINASIVNAIRESPFPSISGTPSVSARSTSPTIPISANIYPTGSASSSSLLSTQPPYMTLIITPVTLGYNGYLMKMKKETQTSETFDVFHSLRHQTEDTSSHASLKPRQFFSYFPLVRNLIQYYPRMANQNASRAHFIQCISDIKKWFFGNPLLFPTGYLNGYLYRSVNISQTVSTIVVRNISALWFLDHCMGYAFQDKESCIDLAINMVKQLETIIKRRANGKTKFNTLNAMNEMKDILSGSSSVFENMYMPNFSPESLKRHCICSNDLFSLKGISAFWPDSWWTEKTPINPKERDVLKYAAIPPKKGLIPLPMSHMGLWTSDQNKNPTSPLDALKLITRVILLREPWKKLDYDNLPWVKENGSKGGVISSTYIAFRILEETVSIRLQSIDMSQLDENGRSTSFYGDPSATGIANNPVKFMLQTLDFQESKDPLWKKIHLGQLQQMSLALYTLLHLVPLPFHLSSDKSEGYRSFRFSFECDVSKTPVQLDLTHIRNFVHTIVNPALEDFGRKTRGVDSDQLMSWINEPTFVSYITRIQTIFFLACILKVGYSGFVGSDGIGLDRVPNHDAILRIFFTSCFGQQVNDSIGTKMTPSYCLIGDAYLKSVSGTTKETSEMYASEMEPRVFHWASYFFYWTRIASVSLLKETPSSSNTI